MRFIAVRAHKDNLMYMFYDDTRAIVVDSVKVETMVHAMSCDFETEYLEEKDVLKTPKTRAQRRLTHVLTTHSHLDHSFGDAELKNRFGDAIFLSHGTTQSGKAVEVCKGLTIVPFHTPSHTTCSVCFYMKTEEKNYLLTGDFIFKLGCGKFFMENGAELFYQSCLLLKENIAPETIMLYGHDYFETNLQFAQKEKRFDMPSLGFFLTFSAETEYNPFLNWMKNDIPADQVPALKEKISALRKRKDEFVPRQ